jgi:hypothetical protein
MYATSREFGTLLKVAIGMTIVNADEHTRRGTQSIRRFDEPIARFWNALDSREERRDCQLFTPGKYQSFSREERIRKQSPSIIEKQACQVGIVAGGNPSVSHGTAWKEERERILMDIVGELVQRLFEVCRHLDFPLLEGVQHGHHDPPRVGSGIRRRAEADLAGVVLHR